MCGTHRWKPGANIPGKVFHTVPVEPIIHLWFSKKKPVDRMASYRRTVEKNRNTVDRLNEGLQEKKILLHTAHHADMLKCLALGA